MIKFSLLCRNFARSITLKSKEDYFHAIPEQHRYDSRNVTVLKRLLQRELPEPVRAEIVRRLFAEHVTTDESSFACELYMSVDQIACLRRHGMHIGSHGNTHAWLDRLSPDAQAIEVDQSLEFLQTLGVGTRSSGRCVIPMEALMTRSFMSFELVIVSWDLQRTPASQIWMSTIG